MDKLMKIRRDDTCVDCGTNLSAGTMAHWFATERVVRCRSCYQSDAATAPLGGSVGEAVQQTSGGVIADAAGGSAQAEYERRSERERARKQRLVDEDEQWRESIKAERPVLGRIASVLTPKPEIGPESQATKAWKTGAEGERRVAEVLGGADGVEVLHDRRVPGSKANIDHIAVGPSGVFVIDAKKYSGQVEMRDVGGLFRADERLFVNNRERTKLVDGVLGQLEVVRAALTDEFADVQVRGVLCFVGCEWGWLMRPKQVRGVTAIWPNALADHVSVEGELGDRLALVADQLRRQLPPAA